MIKYCFQHLTTESLTEKVDQIMNDVIEQMDVHEHSLLFYNLRLAIWELFCNVIVHAHTNEEKKVAVTISEDAEHILLTVEDFSEGFDWEDKMPKSEPRIDQMGGRGLLFIDQISSKFYFEDRGRKAKVFFKRNSS